MSLDQDIHTSTPLGGGIFSLASAAATNTFIDALPAIAAASGWTLVNAIYATYTFDILSMVAGSGFYSEIALIDGVAFRVYNPTDGNPNNSGNLNYAWAGGPYTEYDFAAIHGDHDGNIDSLAAAITLNTTFNAIRVPPVAPFDGRIVLTSKLAGALGNGHDVRGSGHTIGVTQINGGGWRYRSKAAAGVSQFDLEWFQNIFGSLSLIPYIDGHARDAAYEFFAVTRYMHILGPHQFTVFALTDHSTPSLGDTAGSRGGGYNFMISAVWIPDDHALTYCAFSLPVDRGALTQQTTVQIGVNGAYNYANYGIGETGWALNGLYGYEGTDLLTSSGKPLTLTPLVGLAVLDFTERRIVGSLWDGYLTPAFFALDSLDYNDTGGYIAVIANTDGQNATLFLRMPDGFIFS